jgi:beta-xylosidase
VATRGTYTNPVFQGYFADPFVLRDDGVYYAYGTDPDNDGDGVFEVLRSDDLVSWTSLGYALPRIDDPDAQDYWAPEVARRDGHFFLYYSAGIEDTRHRIRVAVADRPEGPFEDAGRVLTADEPFAIDPHPFLDDDGRWYLYYAHDILEGDRPGTSIAVDVLLDPFTLAGDPRPVVRASADWQLFQRQRAIYGGVYDWYTLEGPTVRKHAGRYWCLYSGGAWTDATYGVSFAVADSPLGPFREERVDMPALLRTIPGVVVGPGHNSVVEGPDGDDWIVYHAWDPAMTARRLCIDRLGWTATGPRTTGPTFTPQPAPESAAVVGQRV